MSFHFNSLVDTIFHLFASLPFSYTFKLTTCIRTLLYLKIITSNNKVSEIMPSTSKNTFSSKSLLITYFTCYTWSYNLLFCHGKFPAAQWVEHCTAKAVPVRMEILQRGSCRFFFLILFFSFLYFLFSMIY